MKTPSWTAFPNAALAGRAPRTTTRRTFHSISGRQLANTAGSGGKPADVSNASLVHDQEAFAAAESAGGRTRNLAPGPLRSRQSRRRTASALPPVKLPGSFLLENLSTFSDQARLSLPDALLEDAKHDKTSRLLLSPAASSRHGCQAVESYFQTALTILLLRDCELASDFKHSLCESPSKDGRERWTKTDQIERVIRVWDMILDSAWHLVDSIYPARQAEYTYKIRPFWWWSMHKVLDPRTKNVRDQFLALTGSLEDQLRHAETLAYPLAHAVADLPPETLLAMQRTIERELQVSSPSMFDHKTGKRPITILSLSGYGGKAIAEAVGQHLAFWNRADLIHLDAQDLSLLVGDYLGSNWAYSRSHISMLGFRAAELNGKLARETETPFRSNDEDEDDAELAGFRTSCRSFEEELQKIKQGSHDCFSKWDSLKIDKILHHILHASESNVTTEGSRRPVLIHLHDYVELSMTLEGCFLIGRLRMLVDAAWQQGMQIALVGTSSCEKPSDDYQDAIHECAASDWVITRHLEPHMADGKPGADSSRPTTELFALQQADYFAENVRNINRMIRSLGPPDSSRTLDLSSEDVKIYLRSGEARFRMLKDTILPAPEVFSLASTVSHLESKCDGAGPTAFSMRCALGPLMQKPRRPFLDEDARESLVDMGERHQNPDEAKPEGRAAVKLNEYEKRISSGQINRENLRTTFADVHVPQETTTALRLLTSLALVRPDAFAYGVLAQDRIPGCLLYGPPGTGKTMLAKAVAKESGANMLEISGATVNDKWVGESEKLIRAVFTLAKRMEPCVVFIDEADSLLANRSMFSSRASHREHINQFLKEWDGMEKTNAFIMVATNRPFDLDDAVLRRLPRKILVDLPLKDDREVILRLLLRDETLDSSVSLNDLARRTRLYSGSDLKNVCVAAAMAAVEEENEAAAQHRGEEPYQYPDRRTLRSQHFENALNQIPASISEDMASLKQIRKFDQEYGNRRRGAGHKSTMGFGVLGGRGYGDKSEARIRP